MDKTDYPLLTLILLGRIALICVIICIPIVVWAYASKLADWIKARSRGKDEP